MKVYKIGRDEDCDIILDDDSGMVSRRHAILKSKGFNRYEIVDVSTNGTKVDAIRIKPNTPVKITRNSVVTFAEVKQLDWSKIPDDMKPVRIIAIAVATLVVIIGGWIGYNALTEENSLSNSEPKIETKEESVNIGNGTPKANTVTPADTTEGKDIISEQLKARENAKKGKKADDKGNTEKSKSDATEKSSDEDMPPAESDERDTTTVGGAGSYFG